MKKTAAGKIQEFGSYTQSFSFLWMLVIGARQLADSISVEKARFQVAAAVVVWIVGLLVSLAGALGRIEELEQRIRVRRLSHHVPESDEQQP